jgi:hypothetical protein
MVVSKLAMRKWGNVDDMVEELGKTVNRLRLKLEGGGSSARDSGSTAGKANR